MCRKELSLSSSAKALVLGIVDGEFSIQSCIYGLEDGEACDLLLGQGFTEEDIEEAMRFFEDGLRMGAQNVCHYGDTASAKFPADACTAFDLSRLASAHPEDVEFVLELAERCATEADNGLPSKSCDPTATFRFEDGSSLEVANPREMVYEASFTSYNGEE